MSSAWPTAWSTTSATPWIDPHLKGKLQVELVAFGEGIMNTMHERKATKEERWPFLSYVPSGNGELIIQQARNWAIVRP